MPSTKCLLVDKSRRVCARGGGRVGTERIRNAQGLSGLKPGNAVSPSEYIRRLSLLLPFPLFLELFVPLPVSLRYAKTVCIFIYFLHFFLSILSLHLTRGRLRCVETSTSALSNKLLLALKVPRFKDHRCGSSKDFASLERRTALYRASLTVKSLVARARICRRAL